MTDKEKNIGMYAIRVAANKLNFSNIKQEEKREVEHTFGGEEIDEYNDSFVLMDEESGESLDLSKKVQMDVSRTKNIISTQINGQDSTIKEWISNGEYAINIVISIISERDEYPQRELKRIMNFLSIRRTLKVFNKHLNEILQVTRLVVMGYRHTPNTYKNNQIISVDMSSDESYVIEEKLLTE